MLPCLTLNIIRIKGKVEQSKDGVAPSPTSHISSYWNERLWVTLDDGCQLILLFESSFTPALAYGFSREFEWQQVSRTLFDWLFGFYGMSTFVGYLMPNPFLSWRRMHTLFYIHIHTKIKLKSPYVEKK